jgi:hypothetical protein
MYNKTSFIQRDSLHPSKSAKNTRLYHYKRAFIVLKYRYLTNTTITVPNKVFFNINGIKGFK